MLWVYNAVVRVVLIYAPRCGLSAKFSLPASMASSSLFSGQWKWVYCSELVFNEELRVSTSRPNIFCTTWWPSYQSHLPVRRAIWKLETTSQQTTQIDLQINLALENVPTMKEEETRWLNAFMEWNLAAAQRKTKYLFGRSKWLCIEIGELKLKISLFNINFK